MFPLSRFEARTRQFKVKPVDHKTVLLKRPITTFL